MKSITTANFLAPDQQSAPKPGILDLPDDLLSAILHQVDESSRTSAARACRRMASVAPLARLGAPLPTRVELLKLGFPRPDPEKLLRAFGPLKGLARQEPEGLREHYAQAARLHAAIASGVVGPVRTERRNDYIGRTVNGVPDGYGESAYTSGRNGTVRAEGEWKDGKLSGRGFLFSSNGQFSEGNFVRDQLHGAGKARNAAGESFEGVWIDGKLQGQAVCTRTNGSRYRGEWRDDLQNGHGVSHEADGSRYEGAWKNGKRHGQGLGIEADGSRYEGEWREGRRHGRGTLVGADGSRLSGHFKNDEHFAGRSGGIPLSRFLGRFSPGGTSKR